MWIKRRALAGDWCGRGASLTGQGEMGSYWRLTACTCTRHHVNSPDTLTSIHTNHSTTLSICSYKHNYLRINDALKATSHLQLAHWSQPSEAGDEGEREREYLARVNMPCHDCHLYLTDINHTGINCLCRSADVFTDTPLHNVWC